jgi:hypothetical protein
MKSFPLSVRLAPGASLSPRVVSIEKTPSESVDHHLRQLALIVGMSGCDCAAEDRLRGCFVGHIPKRVRPRPLLQQSQSRNLSRLLVLRAQEANDNICGCHPLWVKRQKGCVSSSNEGIETVSPAEKIPSTSWHQPMLFLAPLAFFSR